MAQSKHSAIRAAVAALLTTAPAVAGGRIYQNREFALATDVASQVHINYDGSDPSEIVITGAPVDWDTAIEITAKARTSGGVSAEDAADALWVEIYSRVMANQALGGLVGQLSAGSAFVERDEADTAVCKLTWRFTVKHRTDNNSIAS
jgi:hypothetical protein